MYFYFIKTVIIYRKLKKKNNKNNIKLYVASSIIKCFARTTGCDFNKSSSGVANQNIKRF